MDKLSTPAYFAIIPADVRYCKQLEDGAKLLYGEIAALTNKEGYCWASNAYFAELYGVETRTIQNRLRSLEDSGFIEVSIEKNGMKTDRKIYIIQNNFTTRKNFHPLKQENARERNAPTDTFQRDEKNFMVDMKKFSPKYNIANNTRITTTEVVAPIHKILEPLELTPDQKMRLTSAFPNADDISHALSYVQNPQTKIKTSFVQALWWAAKNKPQIPQDPKKIVEENKKYAMSLEKKIQPTNSLRFEALSKHAEIIYVGAQRQADVFEYKDLKFKENIGRTLKTMQLSF